MIPKVPKRHSRSEIDTFLTSASQLFCYYSWYIHISQRLVETTPRANEMLHFQLTENAVIMGFLINATCLDEFFHEKKKYPDDVRACEFGFPSTGGFLSPDERRAIDKRIAHPTQTPKNQGRSFYFTYSIAFEALKRVLAFIDLLLADRQLRKSTFGKRIETTRRIYLALWAEYTDLVPRKDQLQLAKLAARPQVLVAALPLRAWNRGPAAEPRRHTYRKAIPALPTTLEP
jgi:hypothetical protein